MDPDRSRILLFQTGLLLFSLLPAAVLLLVLSLIGTGFTLALLSGIAVLTLFQLSGLLYEKGLLTGPVPLRISFWSLKMLQSILGLERYLPEKMVVGMNNRRVLRSVRSRFRGQDTLILAPHCLQNHQCGYRLTFDPDACRRCGNCPIGDMLELRDRFGTKFAIASGGTSARRIVKDFRPELILAVACPVDLSLGILDVHPVTTVGVLNEWRCGPCVDTWVDPAQLRAALDLLVEPPSLSETD